MNTRPRARKLRPRRWESVGAAKTQHFVTRAKRTRTDSTLSSADSRRSATHVLYHNTQLQQRVYYGVHGGGGYGACIIRALAHTGCCRRRVVQTAAVTRGHLYFYPPSSTPAATAAAPPPLTSSPERRAQRPSAARKTWAAGFDATVAARAAY